MKITLYALITFCIGFTTAWLIQEETAYRKRVEIWQAEQDYAHAPMIGEVVKEWKDAIDAEQTIETLITELLPAIAQVESGNNPDAIGDNGNAVGAFQIWKIYVDDVNRFTKVPYDYDDRRSIILSGQMVRLYLTHYGKAYERRTGRPATKEVLARIHNGGPRGYEKDCTLKYWGKVKRIMEWTTA